MNAEQIVLLKKALELYEFVLEQRRESRYDVLEINEFYEMKVRLSELIGEDIT